MLTQLGKSKIAIMGLGYVGLPLAEAFAEKYKIICYDINPIRVDEWQKGKGRTFELTDTELQQVLVKTGLQLEKAGKGLMVTDATMPIDSTNIYIVTMPTPSDKHNRLILTPMIKASEMIVKVLKKGSVIIY